MPFENLHCGSDGTSSLSDNNGKKNILLVDDEECLRDLLTVIFEDAGFGVFIASGATDAFNIFTNIKEAIDLLLCDLLLQEMNGVELAKILRTIKPTLKVLFMSGDLHKVLQHNQSLDFHFDVIQKPFDYRHLIEKAKVMTNV